MRIIFDLRNVGLGNNGGSSTLIKSGNTMVDLGHEVYFVDSFKNKHTWTELKAKHIIIKNEKSLPDSDVIIATGYKSTAYTILAPKRCGIKFHWIRGWETWQMPEDQIIRNIIKIPTIKLVNSLGLYNKISKLSRTYIVRPGYDFDEIYPLENVRNHNKYILGGLYSVSRQGQRKRSDWLFKTFYWFKTHGYKDAELWLFGMDAPPEKGVYTKYFRNPSKEEKNYFYNSINVWMATSELEGLHIPPAEAMLTECAVVGTDAEMAGTSDYLIHYDTGFVSPNNLIDFGQYTQRLLDDPILCKRFGKNGREKILELGSRKENMKKMVSLFRSLI